MEFSFVIPRANKDLLEDAEVSSYYVKNVYTHNEIPDRLRAAQQTLQQSDAFYIFDHFDTFFSVIENADKLHIKVLLRAIDILYKTAENLGQLLDGYLKQENLDRQHDFVNLLKMVMYLLVGTVRAVDAFIKENGSQNVGTGRKKNKQANDDQLPHYASYEIKRYDVLVLLCHIMELPIEKAFENSTIEESFVNMICDMAYRTLSHPSIKEKRINDIVFQILGMAIKSYAHAVAFPVQITQILEREEIAVVPIARGIVYLHDEFRITTVLEVLLKEFIERVDATAATSLIPKHFSMFITEIGDLSPELALECLQMADEILNLEPYNIRNSLFVMMGNVIIGQLTGEGLTDELRDTRDELLEHLLEHVSDVNSYVRSKVLHVWSELETRHAIPLAWKLKLLQVGVERLEDKTATVRKNAITLLRLILESNPFSCRLSIEEIQKKYDETVAKRTILVEKHNQQEAKRADIDEDFKTRCIPELEVILEKLLTDEQAGVQMNMNGIYDDQDDAEKRVQNIRNLLRDGDFEQACRTIIKLDVCNKEAREKMPLQQQILFFIVLLNTYLYDDYTPELEKDDAVVGFLEDSLKFSRIISTAVPKLEYMLLSTTLTDVLEVIEFFKTGYLFNIKGCESGMKSMLRLLYINTSQDKNEKGEAVIRAYHSVLFQTDLEGRAHHIKVVDKLCHFLQNISTGEYTAFELMIKHWVNTKDIDVQIINVMFERFTMKLPNTTSNIARCCMELLILVSNAKPAVAISNLKLITDILGSDRILRDPRIFSGCLKLLKNTQSDKADKANKGTYVFIKRYDDKDVINTVIENFKKFFFYPKLAHFEPIASEAIDFLYRMCDTPDILCQDIIHALCTKINEISEKRKNAVAMDNGDGVESSQVTETYIPTYLLSRIVFLFGYVSSKELVYLDVDVYSNMKHLEELKREKKEKANTIATNKRKSASNLNVSASEALRRKSTTTNGTNEPQEQDETYMGATAEDTIAELIHNICENELITSEKGLFYHFVPILIEILSHPGKYPDQHVQCSAVLTLMRFMIVSGSFCADKIQFLMNIMKKSRNPTMKCNIIIGLADLTCRFANTIEPWIPNFYEMLYEEDEQIRLTTIKMLSYVILQAIVRVTGQLADMASCIVDTNEEIRNVTKEFFHQLVASKEVEYFKILPDIISRLSSNDAPIEEDKFRIIMKYLMELVRQKDRLIDSLVEKLCVRFRNTNKERQWRDVAYCLSLLNHTEKTMRKLIENIGAYKDKIQYDEIYDSFKIIISNANKQVTKPELKNLAKELDTKLQECLDVDQNGDDVSMNGNRETGDGDSSDRLTAPSASQRQKKQTNKRTGPKPKKKSRLDRFAEFDSDEESDENAPPARRAAALNSSTTTVQSARNGKRAQQPASQSSESDGEDVPRRARRRGRARK